VISDGHDRDGLHYLQCEDSTLVSNASTASEVLLIQWHYWLGYVSLKLINKLFPSEKFVSKLEYACQVGKHHRSTFVSRE